MVVVNHFSSKSIRIYWKIFKKLNIWQEIQIKNFIFTVYFFSLQFA